MLTSDVLAKSYLSKEKSMSYFLSQSFLFYFHLVIVSSD